MNQLDQSSSLLGETVRAIRKMDDVHQEVMEDTPELWSVYSPHQTQSTGPYSIKTLCDL